MPRSAGPVASGTATGAPRSPGTPPACETAPRRDTLEDADRRPCPATHLSGHWKVCPARELAGKPGKMALKADGLAQFRQQTSPNPERLPQGRRPEIHLPASSRTHCPMLSKDGSYRAVPAAAPRQSGSASFPVPPGALAPGACWRAATRPAGWPGADPRPEPLGERRPRVIAASGRGAERPARQRAECRARAGGDWRWR